MTVKGERAVSLSVRACVFRRSDDVSDYINPPLAPPPPLHTRPTAC